MGLNSTNNVLQVLYYEQHYKYIIYRVRPLHICAFIDLCIITTVLFLHICVCNVCVHICVCIQRARPPLYKIHSLIYMHLYNLQYMLSYIYTKQDHVCYHRGSN